MQIVIEIPDEEYKRLTYIDIFKLRRYIENGVSLPKGHGRIADVDKMLDEMRATKTYDILFALERVKPIIEADRGV